jgi:S-adenosylmethionine hydrolase
MSNPRVLTLLTDFGTSDVYVGVMKGAIARINPALTAIDLTHDIPPQNLMAARFNLMNAYRYFPPETVHVAVVDPGVGSQRRGIAIQIDAGFLVGPDNGLFSGVLSQTEAIAAVELDNPDYWRTPNPSTTFHGRDIFSPVGAHLASGVPLENLGRAIAPDSLIRFDLPDPHRTETGIAGCIQYIDRFGNLISNIPGSEVEGKPWSVKVSQRAIPTGRTYSDTDLGKAIALIGSHGWVEIAVNGGSAQDKFGLDWGNAIELEIGN